MKGISFLNGKIGYKPIPKTACTSIKNTVFRIESDRDFDSKVDVGNHIHQYWDKNATDISECKNRVLIVRDPIKRFLSAYGNRVQHHRELSLEKVRLSNPLIAGGFEIYNPGLGQFVDGFEKYKRVSSIGHHTMSVSEWISNDLEFFNHIIPMENISDFSRLIEKVSGKKIEFPREQTGGVKFKVSDLSKSQFEYLLNYYKDDYRLLRKYYSFDNAWNEWKRGV